MEGASFLIVWGSLLHYPRNLDIQGERAQRHLARPVSVRPVPYPSEELITNTGRDAIGQIIRVLSNCEQQRYRHAIVGQTESRLLDLTSGRQPWLSTTCELYSIKVPTRPAGRT